MADREPRRKAKEDPAHSSWTMARVKVKNTTPAMNVRKVAHALGLRFRLHCADLPGKPDLVFPGGGYRDVPAGGTLQFGTVLQVRLYRPALLVPLTTFWGQLNAVHAVWRTIMRHRVKASSSFEQRRLQVRYAWVAKPARYRLNCISVGS